MWFTEDMQVEGVLGGDYNSITRKDAGSINNEATIGYEAGLWRMADALRGSVDAAEYNARCSRPHLPQVHIRRFRGSSDEIGVGA